MTSQLANPTANMTNLSSEQKRALLRRLLEEQRQPTPVEAELVPFLASFERQATEFPAVVAFVEGENQYTYQMLNQLANQLARHLQSSGIEKDAVVGVSLETSYELLLALLAIWKIGGVALLLESNWPVFYLQQQISSACPQLILTHSTQQARFSTVGCPLLALDSTMPGLREQPKENLGWLPSLSAVAYVTFPADKGVAVTQGAMATRLDWLSKQFAIDSADHFWHKTPLSDDAGLVELLLPLRCGGRVAGNLVSGAAISDNTTSTPNCPQEAALKLQRGLLEQQITIATFTNQELTLFLAHCNDSWAQQLPALRTIFCYNETPSQATIDRFCQQFDSALYVVFSLAEAAGEVFFSLCQPTTTLQRSALRQPTHIENPHCSIQICDEHLRSVPVGVKGEIVLHGRQMAQGYWQNAPATRMTFVEKHTETSADAAKSNGSKSNGVTSNGENHNPENHNTETGKPYSPPNTLRWLRTGETAPLTHEGTLRQSGSSSGRSRHACIIN